MKPETHYAHMIKSPICEILILLSLFQNKDLKKKFYHSLNHFNINLAICKESEKAFKHGCNKP